MGSRTDAGTLDNRSEDSAGLICGAIAAALLAAVALLIPSGAHGSVYWTNSRALVHANLDGTGADRSFIITGAGGAYGVAVDGAHVYWTRGGGRIGRAKLDGTGVDRSFIITGAGGAYGVAVDGGHIYWTNGTRIGRAKLDGTAVDRSFITGASGARGVAVNGAHIYWTNLSNHTIGRAHLDGTGVDQSFIDGTTFLWGVAVDASHIYWTNPGGAIGRANLNGTNADESFISGAGFATGVAADHDHVYWSSSSGCDIGGCAYGRIGRANLNGWNADQNFITGAGGWFGVAVDSLTSHYRPDGLIKRGSGVSFLGDGVYNRTAAGQTKRSKARRGHARAFDLKVQNDGDTSDAVDVNGCKSSRRFTVTYWKGSADVTDLVTSGGYSTGILAPGVAQRLTLRVKVRSNAAHGAVKSCPVTLSALGDPARKDVVDGKVKAR